MKQLVVVSLFAVALSGCLINTSGDSCAPQMCRAELGGADGGCLVGKPVCCGPSGPKCGDLTVPDAGGRIVSTTLSSDVSGCIETNELGVRCE